MKETLLIANSFQIWILTLILIGVVIFQTIIFYFITKKYAKQSKILSQIQITQSLKIGVICSIGPAMAVFAIAVALIAQIGSPITLARIGVIGSAHFEMIAAQIGSFGTIATENFTPKMLSSAVWIMVLGGSGWLFMVLLFAKKINKIQDKLQLKNPLAITYISSFAPFAIFFTLAFNGADKDFSNGQIASLLAAITGGGIVFLIKKIVASNPKAKWLNDYSIGFAVIAAMIVGSLAS